MRSTPAPHPATHATMQRASGALIRAIRQRVIQPDGRWTCVFLGGANAGSGSTGVSRSSHSAAAVDIARGSVSSMPAAAQVTSPAKPMSHLAGLSQEQAAAVAAPLGACRVIAGPGSGKTRVLTARIAHLIHSHATPPWQIVAITFTNKAAGEMKERLEALLGPAAASDLFAGTFHSLCYRILRRSLARLPGSGRGEGWALYDQDAAFAVMVKLVRAAYPEWKGADVREKAKGLYGRVSRVKNGVLTCHGLTGEQAVYAYMHSTVGSDLTAEERAAADELAEWFDRYEAALRESNALDFDDLLGMATALLRHDGELRHRLRRRWRHILVDEFQDTNSPQYELVKLLAAPEQQLAARGSEAVGSGGATGGRVFVVGDPDQAIYGFRGAEVGNMRNRFQVDFPASAVHRLRDNYRSTASILAAAQAVIARNDDGDRAALRARRGAGNAIRVHLLQDAYEEAEHIGQEISAALRSGACKQEDIAVLLRTHAQARLVEHELVERGIPYVLVGGMPFWRRTEVQDIMAYLRLAVAPAAGVALDRVINVPKRGLGPASLAKLAGAAEERRTTVAGLLFGDVDPGGPLELPELPSGKALGLPPKAVAAVEQFRGAVATMRAALAAQSLASALQSIILLAGYEQHVRDGGCGGKEGDEEERLARLRQLVRAAEQYTPGSLAGAAALEAALDDAEDAHPERRKPAASASAAAPAARLPAAGEGTGRAPGSGDAGGAGGLEAARAFLDEAALYTGIEEGLGGDALGGVRLSTVHAAKGLEFHTVFVPGCTDGLIPLVHPDSVDPAGDLAEETRLFFVSMTRARDRLWLLHTREHAVHGYQNRRPNEPSRFLRDVVRSGHAEVTEAPEPDERKRAWGGGGGGGRGARRGASMGAGGYGQASGDSGGDRARAWASSSSRSSSSSSSSRLAGSHVATGAGATSGSRSHSGGSSAAQDVPAAGSAQRLSPAQERQRRRTGRR